MKILRAILTLIVFFLTQTHSTVFSASAPAHVKKQRKHKHRVHHNAVPMLFPFTEPPMLDMFIRQKLNFLGKGLGGEPSILIRALDGGFFDAARYIITQSPDLIGKPSKDGRLPLHFSIELMQHNLVRDMLKKNSYAVNMAQPIEGLRPLHVAVKLGNINQPTSMNFIRYLYQKGADIHAKDNYGRTALDYAQSYPKIAALLQRRVSKNTVKPKQHPALEKESKDNKDNIDDVLYDDDIISSVVAHKIINKISQNPPTTLDDLRRISNSVNDLEFAQLRKQPAFQAVVKPLIVPLLTPHLIAPIARIVFEYYDADIAALTFNV